MVVKLGDVTDTLTNDAATILSPPSVDPITLGALVLGGLLVVYFANQSNPKESRPSRTKTTKIASSPTLTQDESDVIEALRSQGAKKTDAVAAVKRAKSNGASGFNDLFRGALKSL